jgi:multisubunit Na+/H+ antiporter MnhG subunit
MSMTMEPLPWALALIAGAAIAVACGLRAFLPLLVYGLGARFLGLPLAPKVGWLASDPALIALGVATVLEILADKVPAVDHAMDVAATFVRPAAAVVASLGLMSHWPAPWGQLAAIAFGGAALMVHAAKAKTRLGSSLLTLGVANPFISFAEDLVTTGLIVLAFLAPIIAGVLVVLLVIAIVRAGRWWRRRRAASVGPA